MPLDGQRPVLRVGEELVVAHVVEVVVHHVVDAERPALRVEGADVDGVVDRPVRQDLLFEVLHLLRQERPVVNGVPGAIDDHDVLAVRVEQNVLGAGTGARGRLVEREVRRDVVNRVRRGGEPRRSDDDVDVLLLLEREGRGHATLCGAAVDRDGSTGIRGRRHHRDRVDAVERRDVVARIVRVEGRAKRSGRHREPLEGGGTRGVGRVVGRGLDGARIGGRRAVAAMARTGRDCDCRGQQCKRPPPHGKWPRVARRARRGGFCRTSPSPTSDRRPDIASYGGAFEDCGSFSRGSGFLHCHRDEMQRVASF